MSCQFYSQCDISWFNSSLFISGTDYYNTSLHETIAYDNPT